ncbi:choice-of-anchor Q domain-containing protein [Parapedobacter koreensis]|uniref:Right handed beta helix region n=1 Tax=Parapedobacter koreensis TaxID=332977 RepID=A0A1H7TKN2_9SPHI|nr:choice-of-anchor Q domain-containing protein [Parapedobacter koreensis]SEL84896.1 hypothetical protein SAMN05421740_111103 [Parapedobacter koreensis]
MKKLLTTLFSAIRLAAGLAQPQAIRYVKAGGAGNRTGTSWDDASDDLQAMVAAAPRGGEIWVAAGEYRPTGSAFVMKEGVKIYGGFPVPDAANPNPGMNERDWWANKTVLKANGRRVVHNKWNGLTAAAVLDGFVITGGRTNDKGGGICNRGVSPTLANLMICDNQAWGGGGGIFHRGGTLNLSGVTIRDNSTHWNGGGVHCSDCGVFFARVIISDNTADVGSGGGIYSRRIAASSMFENVVINGNSATASGGGIFHFNSSPILRHVTISDNRTTGDGGGLYNCDSSPVLTHVTICDNRTIGDGGGIFNAGNSRSGLTHVIIRSNQAANGGGICQTGYSPELTLTHVTIRDNKATLDGGGMWMDAGSSTTLTNVVISRNAAAKNGGGISCMGNSGRVILTNVTISSNSAGAAGGGLYHERCGPILTNTIIWNNRADGNAGSTSASVYRVGNTYLTASYSLIANSLDNKGNWVKAIGNDGGNNIDADPLFEDEATANYYLTIFSMAIDAGDPKTNKADYAVQAGDIDLAGNSRIAGSCIDMGAYERQVENMIHQSSSSM